MAAAIRSAEAAEAVTKAQKTAAEADLESAQAETAVAQRQLEELDVQIAYATLKAPFSGIVSERALDPGDLVREGNEVGQGKPLFVISRIDRVRVRIPVPEADAALVQRGDPIELSFPSFPAEEKLQAKVTRFAGVLDPHTRTMLVEAEINNVDHKLLPGMFGQASITLSRRAEASMLPARSVRFDESGQAYLYVVDGDQTVSIVQVATGVDDGQWIEILSGVEPGQAVIDAHLRRFAAGEKVTPLAP
ncbi:efflux RND transporter periplasmic adaptor subunit [Lignipirellula cremea]|uniref:efflux RND transporter periplasmic adaptor subunit n=1 Tax=Lignipirellula cremea TaxID=2528010 RepID=UPI00119E6C82|nr:efflux RND transporter periplasmic adaptor subunit [Lignipirellula cremea]